LIAKHNRAELSGEERLELNEWINLSPENAGLFAEVTDPAATRAFVQQMDGYDEAAIRAKIESHYPYAFVQEPKLRRIWYRVAAAAAVLVLLGSGVYYYFNNSGKPNTVTRTKNELAARDIAAPKNNRATITLSGGQKVFLDSAAKGTLAVQGSVKVEKLADGKITYNGTAQPKTAIEYNTLTNPRGSRVIDITLSDGSRVWLNAESSLKYPVAFAGIERKVEITGEAYFEVAHDRAKPFTVSKGNVQVQVLGTHFNVNAYDDEQMIKVTLLEGSVKVTTAAPGTTAVSQQRLSPGEAALVQAGEVMLVRKTDLEEVMAWKNGIFQFDNAGIGTIMSEVGRWYDVQVEYKGTIPEGHYRGRTSRDLSASQMLKILQFSGIHFTIEGNKIIVSP